ncbi:hypothetical protein GW17_00012043 [Ensete ventricosum]|nr:hypothetical protein GW17_00012043 [Ensete ventricosum]RZS16719.1 hypothetical protein BHM03_00048748 [Ensete ventricosum]
MRDKIMRRYDQELLGAPLWCMTQQEEALWIQGVNVVVPQRRVFVYASELALDESLSHQHMGAVYHRGRSPNASTKLLGGHSGVEVGGQKGRGSDDKSNGARLPKSKASVEMRWTQRSTTVPQRRIYRSRRKG